MKTTTTAPAFAKIPVQEIAPVLIKPFTHILCVEGFKISSNSITLNGMPLFNDGQFAGDAFLPDVFNDFLEQNSCITLFAASVGEPGAVLHAVYEANNGSFTGTLLEQHFRLFRQTFTAFPVIEVEIDDEAHVPAFAAFCEMLTGMGYAVSFEPKVLEQPSARLEALAGLCPPLIRHWYGLPGEPVTINGMTQWLADFADAITGRKTTTPSPALAMAG